MNKIESLKKQILVLNNKKITNIAISDNNVLEIDFTESYRLVLFSAWRLRYKNKIILGSSDDLHIQPGLLKSILIKDQIDINSLFVEKTSISYGNISIIFNNFLIEAFVTNSCASKQWQLINLSKNKYIHFY